MAFVDNATGGRIITFGLNPVRIVLAAACKVGDLLGLSSGTYVLCTGTTASPPVFVAGQAGASGDTITAYETATIDFGAGSTATPGVALYASAATPGAYTSTAPADAKAVGRMATATVGVIDLPHSNPSAAWTQATTMGNRTLADADTLPTTVGHLNRLVADLQAAGILG